MTEGDGKMDIAYDNIHSDIVGCFFLIGLITCLGVIAIIAIFLYYYVKEKVKKIVRNARRQNTKNCCQKCGAYAPYYKDKYGTKWNCIDYCPRCGHDMQDERFYK